ncbi:MAG: universal stress protein [Cyclobacteriaceae bacterium]
MKKILVPTDFSPYADTAMQFAANLVVNQNAEIMLFHVLLTPVNWAKLSKEQESLFPDTLSAIRQAKAHLSERVDQIKKKGIEVQSQIHFTDGKEQVINFLDKEKIDLVVMGSHGKYGFKAHVLGSNTYTILRKSGIPVFVVKPSTETIQFKKVVLAIDFKEASGKAFQYLTDIIRLLGGEPQLLYVNTPANFMEDEHIHELGQAFLKNHAFYPHEINIYSAYNVERGIIQFCNRIQADAVAIITHGKTDLQQLFSPSVTENLITYLNKPVLSLNVSEMKDQ